MKILLVEDNDNLAIVLKKGLTSHRYQVDWAKDGAMGLALAETESYDLLLLDLYLPQLTAIELCRQIRSGSSLMTEAASNQEIPILILTGEADIAQKVLCLDAGADDYVVKPVDLDELLARIRALLRRCPVQRSPLLQWGDLQLDPGSCEVRFQEQILPLTSREYVLLELFLRNPKQLFSPTRLIERLWSSEDSPSEATVRVHIQSLRQKLKQAGAEDLIETQYGLGYRLRPLEDRSKIQI